MNVAFILDEGLVHANSNIKMKYFNNYKDYNLYYFVIKSENKTLFSKYDYKGKNIIKLPYNEFTIINQIKNALFMKRLIKENNIKIIHIISTVHSIYAILLKNYKIKIVIENYGSDILLAPLKNKNLKYLYQLSFKFTNAVIQDSLVVQKKAIEYGASRKNNYIVELGIDLSVFNLDVKKNVFKSKYNLDKDCKIVFSPRAFRDLYNINQIIDTISIVKNEFSNVKYVFCSYVNNTNYIRRIERLGLNNNVIILGYINNPKEMAYIYADSDVVVSIPSSDSSPRTVYEAIATGATTIISDLPWYQGKLIPNEEVIVTRLNDIESLSDKIMKVLGGNIILNKEKGFNTINKMLNYKKFAFKLDKIYKSIVK